MIDHKVFTMSMFATKEDLYEAKAKYYEKLAKEMEGVLERIVLNRKDGFHDAIDYLDSKS